MEEKEIMSDGLEESFRKEVLKSLDKEKLTKDEIKKLTEEAKESIDFLQKIDEIELPKDKYVIFTDGEEQLYYENGEFYVISTTDGRKMKKKKTKKEATDMYLDYFIKYQLNPILDQKNILKEKREKLKEKEVVKEKATKTKATPTKKTVAKETKAKVVKEKEIKEKEPEVKTKKIEKDEKEISL